MREAWFTPLPPLSFKFDFLMSVNRLSINFGKRRYFMKWLARIWIAIALVMMVGSISLVWPGEVINPPPKVASIIQNAAQKHNVSSYLVMGLIMAESGYNRNAVSKRGAKGYMQLMPKTAKSLGVTNIFDSAQNIHGGVRYFKQLLDRFDGNATYALAAYNAGKANVLRYKGVPPFKYTKLYIKRVFRYAKYYREKGGDIYYD
jgi:soluble lytic murein transglycosylase-like protein